ncbi:hypothetical protein BDN72DRAFT_870138 [Pluteus cervinus]|uniref:Uncharacterized protein n=1 Tax=Pluteus cervinus TaxID=181527 RepID=A0ACD3AZG6_9AGAR|nr:hypothetical protein BDN72DRAFT_870138 [Pluteus cervinus]
MPLTTLREISMMNLMNSLTDKPKWDVKVFDPEIISKWKTETLGTPGIDFSERMFDWCIAELQYKAGKLQETGSIVVFNGGAVKSDTIVPEDLRLSFIDAVKPLEDVSAKFQDWHPGSDGKVLDLVHPSLFPLVYSRSHILPCDTTSLEDCISRCGEGEIIPVSKERAPRAPQSWGPYVYDPFSIKFQWLPCEVDISSGHPRIRSYINNLHPQQQSKLYELIEKLISHAIPLWNSTLTPQRTGHHLRILYTECKYDPNYRDRSIGPQFQQDERFRTESWTEYWNRRKEWHEQVKQLVLPEPDKNIFEDGTSRLKAGKYVDLQGEFKDTGLQVIVKLANIVLTPEKPEYEGGTWHVEGQLNEHICATALYYYDSENITASRLAFRHVVQPEKFHPGVIRYSQYDHRWLPGIFGCENEKPCIQEIGSIETRQGRLITFPNIFQHQVQPFKLADPTKPGHRKIIALFLVDPTIKIISTANVPCQQKDWWKQEICNSEEPTRISKLPIELRGLIFDWVEDFPLSMDEAKELRLELMAERSKFKIAQHDVMFASEEFSLCEH